MGGLRQTLTDSGIDPSYVDMFLSGVALVDTSNRADLHVLIDMPARKGKGAKVVSRRFRNIFIDWYKPLELATKLATTGGLAAGAEQGLEHLWLSGAGNPWGAVAGAIVGILLAWKTVIGTIEVELSNDHAKIVYYLFKERAGSAVTLQDVHAQFDSTVGEEKVNDLLTDLGLLGVIGFDLDEIQLREKLITD